MRERETVDCECLFFSFLSNSWLDTKFEIES